MIQIFTSPVIGEIGMVRSILEGNGIRCVTRNEQTFMAAGAIPLTDVWPELWVLNDADADDARELLKQWQSSAAPASETWTCPGCGEEVEGQFTACWNCSRPRSDQATQ